MEPAPATYGQPNPKKFVTTFTEQLCRWDDLQLCNTFATVLQRQKRPVLGLRWHLVARIARFSS
jgi:hypothetical protein